MGFGDCVVVEGGGEYTTPLPLLPAAFAGGGASGDSELEEEEYVAFESPTMNPPEGLPVPE